MEIGLQVVCRGEQDGNSGNLAGFLVMILYVVPKRIFNITNNSAHFKIITRKY